MFPSPFLIIFPYFLASNNYEALFKTIDADEDGRVDIKELRASLKEWGKKYPGLLEVTIA